MVVDLVVLAGRAPNPAAGGPIAEAEPVRDLGVQVRPLMVMGVLHRNVEIFLAVNTPDHDGCVHTHTLLQSSQTRDGLMVRRCGRRRLHEPQTA